MYCINTLNCASLVEHSRIILQWIELQKIHDKEPAKGTITHDHSSRSIIEERLQISKWTYGKNE